MILDAFAQFTAAAGDSMPNGATTTSTNILDIGLSGLPLSSAGGGASDLGVGDKPALKILVEVTTAGAGTSIAVNLQGAPDNGSGAPGSLTGHASGPVGTAVNAITSSRPFKVDVQRPLAGVV